jgi:hypothetical protein
VAASDEQGHRAAGGHPSGRRLQAGAVLLLLEGLGLATWVWVHVVQPPFTTLVRNRLADDAFYYFDLARHFPRPEATPGIVTTGFHPLYWVLTAPFFKLFGATAAVRASMLLLFAAHAATGLVIYLLARRRFPEVVAGAAAGGWLLSVHVRGLVSLGLETPLAVLAVALVALVVDRPADAPRRWLLTGVLVGVAFLARTDSIVLTAPVVAWSFLRGRHVRDTVATAAVAAVVASPWLVFLFLHSAVGAQDSVVSHRLASGRSGIPVAFIGPVFRYLGRNLALAFLPSDVGGRWPLIVVAVGLGVALAVVRLGEVRRWLVDRAGLAAGAVLLFLLYALVLRFVDIWYTLYGLFVAWVLAVPPLLALVVQAVRRLRAPGALLAAVLALTVTVWWLWADDGAFAQVQLDLYRAARVATVRLPSTTKLGSFNSGLLQFEMRQAVVNLDGVVNPGADRALRDGTMCQYLHQEGIRFLIDTENGFDRLGAVAPRVRVGPSVILRDGKGAIPNVRFVALDTTAC